MTEQDSLLTLRAVNRELVRQVGAQRAELATLNKVLVRRKRQIAALRAQIKPTSRLAEIAERGRAEAERIMGFQNRALCSHNVSQSTSPI